MKKTIHNPTGKSIKRLKKENQAWFWLCSPTKVVIEPRIPPRMMVRNMSPASKGHQQIERD